jgi:hypothetical protein
MGTIKVNGITFQGNSIQITNSKVIVDGKEIKLEDSKIVNITVEGNVESIHADVCESIIVKGTCKKAQTMSGNITIEGNVEGNVKTMSGNVSCGDIAGNASSMSGNIRRK